ncbi:MAG: hypothetical protein PHE10_02525 [Kiritimatiellae bacterium]|nr:hypothetical protein [Kiritimatiellia bacterium]
MKKHKPKARNRATPRPTKKAYTALRQIVQWIPEGLPDRIAREAKADIMERRGREWRRGVPPYRFRTTPDLLPLTA